MLEPVNLESLTSAIALLRANLQPSTNRDEVLTLKGSSWLRGWDLITYIEDALEESLEEAPLEC